MTTTIYSNKAARQLDQVTVAEARAKADAAAARAATERAEAEAATAAARVRAEREQRKVAAEARRQDEADKARRKTARLAARRAVLGRVMARRELAVTVAVICVSVAVALPAQIGFLHQRWGLVPAILGGLLPESLTWAFAVQGRRREVRGLSARTHHVGTWVAACTAAGINLVHGSSMWGVQFGVIAALGSLAAPILWHAYLVSASTVDDGRSPEQVREDRRRRRHHRAVHRLAQRIATSQVPAMDPSEAWAMAWRLVHHCEPGVTRRQLAHRNEVAKKVRKLIADGPDAGAVLPSLGSLAAPPARPAVIEGAGWRIDPGELAAAFTHPARAVDLTGRGPVRAVPAKAPRAALTPAPTTPASPAREGAAGGPRAGASSQVASRVPPAAGGARTAPRAGRGARPSAGARAAAAATARAATPAQIEREKQAARAWLREQHAAGRAPAWRDLAEHTGRGETWCRKLLRETADAGLHLVAAAGGE